MRKNKEKSKGRKASLSRGAKRGIRLKKTQSQKHEKKLAEIKQKKIEKAKEEEEVNKLLRSRSF